MAGMLAAVVVRSLVGAVECGHAFEYKEGAKVSLCGLCSDRYICYGEQSHAVLKKLKEDGKKMFLITNSPFDFV